MGGSLLYKGKVRLAFKCSDEGMLEQARDGKTLVGYHEIG